MKDVLSPYLPERAVDPVFKLIQEHNVYLKIVNNRVTKHGDYRRLPNGQHQITVNGGMNKYQFLITTVHEIAHLVAFKKYGRFIKPHGKEWKLTFQKLMVPLINPTVFPSDLLPLLARHFRNPKASSSTDEFLSVALKKYDPVSDKNFVFEIPVGSVFRLYNGKIFRKGNRLRKRYQCEEIRTGKQYLFSPQAEVELIKIH